MSANRSASGKRKEPQGNGSIQGHFDGISDWTAYGWVRDASSPGRRVRVALIVDGQPLLTTTAQIQREDVREAGFGDGLCGFEFPLTLLGAERGELVLTVRTCAEEVELSGGPHKVNSDIYDVEAIARKFKFARFHIVREFAL